MDAPHPQPFYRPAGTTAAYQLRWSLAVFWGNTPPTPDQWLSALQRATEPDGVRILEHRFRGAKTSQFLVSSQPSVSPSQLIRSVKGRLQYLVRGDQPQALTRNYSLISVGDAEAKTVERYIATQLEHHRMADARVQDRLVSYQIDSVGANRDGVRHSGHGEFIYNLHLVLVHADRWSETRDHVLCCLRDRMPLIATKKGYRLTRASVFPDHVHLLLGCGIDDCPESVALAYLNNLAWAQDQRPVYISSYYVGTCGPYDMAAVRRSS